MEYKLTLATRNVVILLLVLLTMVSLVTSTPVKSKSSNNPKKKESPKMAKISSPEPIGNNSRLSPMFLDCSKHNWSRDHGCNITSLLDALLDNYDKRLRPLMNMKKPVTVTVGFWILSIDSINVIDMDYQIDFFFRQSWQDLRLQHTFPEPLTVSNTMLEKIWLPDTYFENSKGSHFHEVTVPNKMLKITPEGTIMYNARISVRASCPMDLRMFPMDVQACRLNIESYGYHSRDIVFRWEDAENKISIGDKVRTLPQYNLTGFRTLERWTHYVVGTWSGLTAVFILERRTGYFFLHLYAPCALIVMISWISFCIPKDSTAARVALGITSVLTITTILNMLNTSMPKVSYIKAVDWYLIVSFLFVFAVLLEYTIILYLTDREKQREIRSRRIRDKKERKLKEMNFRKSFSQDDNSSYDRRELRPRGHGFGKENSFLETTFDGRLESTNGRATSVTKPLLVVFDGKCNANFQQANNSDHQNHRNKQDTGPVARLMCRIRIDAIDEYARMLFPISFATFNIVYWVLFFSKKTGGEE